MNEGFKIMIQSTQGARNIIGRNSGLEKNILADPYMLWVMQLVAWQAGKKTV